MSNMHNQQYQPERRRKLPPIIEQRVREYSNLTARTREAVRYMQENPIRELNGLFSPIHPVGRIITENALQELKAKRQAVSPVANEAAVRPAASESHDYAPTPIAPPVTSVVSRQEQPSFRLPADSNPIPAGPPPAAAPPVYDLDQYRRESDARRMMDEAFKESM